MNLEKKTSRIEKQKQTNPFNQLSQIEWWGKGVQFQCQGSGKCCTSHGEYGFVFLSLDDRKRMAKFLNIAASAFTRKYCERNEQGAWHLIERKESPDCMFFNSKGKSCSVYEARPTQCRTWPFWPEVMKAKTWNKEVLSFCPGIGKGPLHSGTKISNVLHQQRQNEVSMLNEGAVSSREKREKVNK